MREKGVSVRARGILGRLGDRFRFWQGDGLAEACLVFGDSFVSQVLGEQGGWIFEIVDTQVFVADDDEPIGRQEIRSLKFFAVVGESAVRPLHDCAAADGGGSAFDLGSLEFGERESAGTLRVPPNCVFMNSSLRGDVFENGFLIEQFIDDVGDFFAASADGAFQHESEHSTFYRHSELARRCAVIGGSGLESFCGMECGLQDYHFFL